MVEIDNCLVSIIIASADVKLFADTRTRIKPEAVKSPFKEVYIFIGDYFDKYKGIPTFKTVEENFGKDYKCECESGLEYYINEIVNREVYNAVSVKLNEVYPFMEKGRGVEALAKLDVIVKDIYKGMSTPDDVKSLFNYGDDVWRMYEKAKKGMIGISTPFKSLNEITLGWQPEDLAVFVSRSGTGKTWLLIMLARQAWEVDKKRVLFVSPEIANARVFYRFLSGMLKLDYDIMRRGKLGDMAEKNLKKKIDELVAVDDGSFKIIGREFGADIGAVERAIIITEPEIVFIDGIYLMKRKNDKSIEKHERIANVIDDTKGLAKRYSVPIIAASQLNRKASGKRDIKDDMLSFTDALMHNSDYVFAMIQDIDMRTEKIMNIQPLKVREGDMTNKIILRWDFTKADFGEIIPEETMGDKEIPF